MNKECIYVDGKVIVEDENGNKRITEYSDNLEEILAQENLIETMENKIQELDKELGNTKEDNKPYVPFVLPTWFFSLILAKPIFGVLGFDTTTISQTVFGPMNDFTLTLLVVGAATLPLFCVYEKIYYNQIKYNQKARRADIAEYDYLNKEIKIQKEKLEKLKKEKTITTEASGFSVKEVNDIEELNNLESWLILYSNLGYDMRKYYKLYQSGKLEEYLENEGYTEVACECAKEYVSEQGPKLVKRK